MPVTATDSREAASSEPRILVVDDEEHAASTTARMLEDRGLECEWVTSGIDALSRISNDSGEYDGVVSDFVMRQPDGLELLKSVRRIAPRLPFVLYTGRGSEKIASEAIKEGVTDYLQKGGIETYDLLENCLRNAIRQARIREDLEETRARFEALMQITDSAVITIDSSRTIRYVNDAIETQFGYEPQALQGGSLDDLVPADYRASFTEGVARYFDRDERVLDWADLSYPVLDASGERVGAAIQLGSHRTENGHLVTAVIERTEDGQVEPDAD